MPESLLRGISLTLQATFYFILIEVVVSASYTLLFGAPLEFDLLPLLIGIGIFTTIQQVSKTAAYRHTEASLLASFGYSAIVWATILGWIFWKEFPTFSVVIGSAVVIVSNLFIGLRERQAQLTVL